MPAKAVPVLPVPCVPYFDPPRAELPLQRCQWIHCPPEEFCSRLERMTRRLGVTPFMALLSGFATLLYRYGGQPDILVGTPIANRGHAELEDLIGFFANTLALRVDLFGDPGFDVLACRVRERALGAYAHQDFPFERLVNELRPERSLSHSPVFQVMLGLQNLPESELDLAGLTLSPLKLEAGGTQFDLSLFVHPLPKGGMLARLFYARDLFDAATAERLLGHLQTLLHGAVDCPEIPISRLPLLNAGERAQLTTWDETIHRTGHAEGLLHGLFEAQAGRTPEALALVAGADVLSYAELAARSARLAARLRLLGLGPEMGVAVCLERTADLVVALLAVLRAGAFYVPLDPRYPVERLRFLLEDSGAGVVVTQSRLAAELLPPATRCLLLDERETVEPVSPQPATAMVTAQNLAYLIYTSGSTGRPKAVAIHHQSAVELAFWAREAFSEAELRGVLASTAVTFDLSVFEIFVPLAWGGTVVLAENALELSAVAAALPAGVEITLVNTVPSAMAELLREGGLPASVRTLNLAGEALPRGLADQAYARPGTERLCNLYGPSEDTTYSTWTVVERTAERSPSIGRPVHGTRAYVLDALLERLPVGIPGELYLAGAGLARGYLGRPELTAERFLPDLFAGTGGRMYRTGDRVRLRPAGELEYLGRLDHQVKVRGYRIELGEVEAALACQPGVEFAVVLAREDLPGERRLVAYVVAPGAELETAELRRALQLTLPEPFIPSVFVFLETLPLTSHGKVDRRALPAPGAALPDPGADFAAPRNPVEEALAAVWAEVLRRERIGIHNNFFDLGGDSIRTIQVVARSRQRGLRISPRQLFQHQTIAELAAVVEVDRPTPEPAADVALPLNLAQRRRAEIAETGREAVWLAPPADIGREAVERALSELSTRHDALRLRFTYGPEGWSQHRAPVGTGVALERAAAEPEALQLLAGGSEALRAALLPDGCLILAAHPLAVDGPSWDLLLADLAALCPGTVPFYGSPALDGRRSEVHGFGEPVTVYFGEVETAALLGEAQAAYGNTVEEMLLAAVAGARAPFHTLAEVEGLRPGVGGLEEARAVGCLAVPVQVQAEECADPGTTLKEVKERLRQALRQAIPAAPAGIKPDLVLRFTPPLVMLRPWRAQRITIPPAAAARLRVDCRLEDGRLRADWTSADRRQQDDLERIAERFRERLSALIQHCQSAEAGGFTPSDFPVSNLGQAELDELLAELG